MTNKRLVQIGLTAVLLLVGCICLSIGLANLLSEKTGVPLSASFGLCSIGFLATGFVLMEVTMKEKTETDLFGIDKLADLETIREELAEKVEEHPAVMLSAAVMAGVLIGALTSTSSRKQGGSRKSSKSAVGVSNWIASEFGSELQVIKQTAISTALKLLDEKMRKFNSDHSSSTAARQHH